MWHYAFADRHLSEPVKSLHEVGLVEQLKVKQDQQISIEGDRIDMSKPQTDEFFMKLSDVTLKMKIPEDTNCHLVSKQSSDQEARDKVKIELLNSHSQIDTGIKPKQDVSNLGNQPKLKSPKKKFSGEIPFRIVPQDGGAIFDNPPLRGTPQSEKVFTSENKYKKSGGSNDIRKRKVKKNSPGKEEKRRINGNIKEILERIKRKKENTGMRKIEDQVSPEPQEKESRKEMDLPRVPGKVKNLILDFERKRKEEERKERRKETIGSGLKKQGRKKNVDSASSPAVKKSLKILTKPHQKTLVDFWGQETCKLGSPLSSKNSHQ